MASSIKSWIKAFRLRTLFLALSSIFMGSFLAASQGKFNLLVFILSTLTATFLQILSNLANDYGDYVHGADSAFRVGPSRAVQAGEITATAMKGAIGVMVVLSLACGLYLLYVGMRFSPINFLGFFLLGILAIVAAIKYTAGRNPYGYAGFGDIVVFIFFGWVAVLGSYYLQTQSLDLHLFLPATSCGLFSVAVLNVNNIRDIDSDKLAGKKSIPVRIGRQNAKLYHWSLLIGGLLCAVIDTLINYHSYIQFLFLLSLPLLLKNGMMISKTKNPADLNPYLKQMAISTLLFVLTFGLGLMLSMGLLFNIKF